MAGFSYDGTPFAVPAHITDSHDEAWQQLARCGTWWTAAQRLAIASRARHRFASRATPPWLRDEPPSDGTLSAETAAIVHTVTLDAGSIDRAWASAAIADIGDGHYVELIAIVATVVMVDVFAEAVGVDPTPLPEPVAGDATEPSTPSRERPGGLGDIGAHVAVLDPFPHANVARALNLVPAANTLFRTVSVPAYSAPGFADLTWDTPLSRPQVELVASRVAAMNECFY
jgi:hypothetical protein